MAILDIQTTDLEANFLNDLLRRLGHGFFNRTMFWFLGVIYQIFFNVATAEILGNATIRNFYGRIQLILGVFMVFRLSITVLQAIVDPDRAQHKSEGFSAIIKRVVIGLLMLTVLTPINIPGAKNSFEKEINNNGILFGVLYDLQYRILEQNTLGSLILGTNDGSKKSDNRERDEKSLMQASGIFTSTIAKAFMNINLKEGKTDDTKSENWMCENIDSSIIDEYKALDVPTSKLYSNEWITLSCTKADENKTYVGGLFTRSTGKDRYVFNYILFLPFIAALVFSIVLVGFTVDIAIRAFKLIVLRIIAPIPVIAYMGPESKNNTSFSNWCRALAATYLDLFIRLAVVYFVLYLIIDMITNGIIIRDVNALGIISMIFIWLGLFLFAKQAPKFILDVLGVKSLGSNIGLGTILGGSAMLAGGLKTGFKAGLEDHGESGLSFGKIMRTPAALRHGLFGALGGGATAFAQGAMNGMTASNLAASTGKEISLGDIHSKNKDLMAQIRTGDRDAKGGMFGYMTDRLNFHNRELRANSLGINRNSMAAAMYEEEVANDNYNEARAASSSAASKVSAMKGAGLTKNRFGSIASMMGVDLTRVAGESEDDYNKRVDGLYRKYGGVLSQEELSVKYGRDVSSDEYTEFVGQYKENVDKWVDALDAEEKARVQTLITGAAKKSMDSARGNLGVAPRVSDVYSKSYRSQRQVTMGDNRTAVDKDGVPIVDENGKRLTGEDYRDRYRFEDSITAFNGTMDDSSYGSSGRGSGIS